MKKRRQRIKGKEMGGGERKRWEEEKGEKGIKWFYNEGTEQTNT